MPTTKKSPKKCPSGQILRRAYSKSPKKSARNQSKTHVSAACIKDQGSKGKSKPSYRKSPKTHVKCPFGQIPRASYTRAAYIKKSGQKVHSAVVSEACIKDVGAPGKGPIVLPELDKKLVLRDFGYSLSKPSKERHSALSKAIKATDKNTVIWHLNYLRNISAYKENKDKFSKDLKAIM